MGRFCIACGHERSNESFGGKGRRRVVCSKCRQLPKAELTYRLGSNECYGFLYQKNISAKNIQRLQTLETEGIERLTLLAQVIREIALIYPRPKHRWLRLQASHPELYQQACELQLCDDDVDDDSFDFGAEVLEDNLVDDEDEIDA